MIFFDTLRPSECPLCGRKYPLRKHGTYSRYVYGLFCDSIEIKVVRFYCPGCRRTVSILPSFCLPHKRFSAAAVSCCLQLILACTMSLRAVSKAYPTVSRVLAGIWVKQWSFSASGIISVLRNNFGFDTTTADVCVGHNSRYITSTSLEAFFGSSDFVLGHELVDCHGQCDITGRVICEKCECHGILQALQERFSTLPFQVRLF